MGVEEPKPSSVQMPQLLEDWAGGDRSALDRLTPVVYGELRRLAAGFLRQQRSNHTLQPTALVHEAYMRLAGEKKLTWKNRAHFFGIAANAMRHILVEHARRRAASKRSGSTSKPLSLDHAVVAQERPQDLIALDDALRELASADPHRSQIIELRFFGGLTAMEIGEVIGASESSVKRHLRGAQAWLSNQLGGEAV